MFLDHLEFLVANDPKLHRRLRRRPQLLFYIEKIAEIPCPPIHLCQVKQLKRELPVLPLPVQVPDLVIRSTVEDTALLRL